jgi:hypothetical protein
MLIEGGVERGIKEEVPSGPLFVIWHVTGAGVNAMFTKSWLNAGLDGSDFVCGIHQKLKRVNNIGRHSALCSLRRKRM